MHVQDALISVCSSITKCNLVSSIFLTLNGVWSLTRTWTRPWLVEILVRLSFWLRELQSKFYIQHFVSWCCHRHCHLELRLIVPNGLQDGVGHVAGGQHKVVGETEQQIRAQSWLSNQRAVLPEEHGEHEARGGQVHWGLGELVLQSEEGLHHRDVSLYCQSHCEVHTGCHRGLKM